MFYYLYEVKNLKNGKVYIGVHKTSDMNDGYMGSGRAIKSAIKQYGTESFEKTVLETFSNSDDMFSREREIVTEDFISRPDTYNARCGGWGGSVKGALQHSNETKSRISSSMKGKTPCRQAINSLVAYSKSEENRERMKDAMTGISKSEAHKQKISEAMRKSWLKRKTTAI